MANFLGQVDRVCYNDANGSFGLYVNGKLVIQGDDYHDSIRIYMEAFLAGIEYAGLMFNIDDHQVDDKQSEKFCEDGYDVPKVFPNKYFKKKK